MVWPWSRKKEEEDDGMGKLVYELDGPLSNKFIKEVLAASEEKAREVIADIVGENASDDTINDYVNLAVAAVGGMLKRFGEEYRRGQDTELEVIIGPADEPGLAPIGTDIHVLPQNYNKPIKENNLGVGSLETMVYKDNNRQVVVQPIPFGVAVSVENKFGDNLYLVGVDVERKIVYDKDVKDNLIVKKKEVPTALEDANIIDTTPADTALIRMAYNRKEDWAEERAITAYTKRSNNKQPVPNPHRSNPPANPPATP